MNNSIVKNGFLGLDKIYNADCLEGMKQLPPNFIDCCITSPPYWALRDYGVDGQLGLEPTFEQYINQLCDIFDEVKRVLKDEGTCWVNLGDTYSGSCQGASKKTKERIEEGKIENLGSAQTYLKKYGHALTQKPPSAKTSVPDKSLCMIPFRFAIEMVNRGWILRNTIIWHKPNCMPSSAKDRFTVDFEYLFFFTKSNKYWFETQYEPYQQSTFLRAQYGIKSLKMATGIHGGMTIENQKKAFKKIREGKKIGRIKRAVWRIPTRPFKGSHFATYPENLVETPIKSGCPEYICQKCGTPRTKIYEGKSEQAFNIRIQDVKKGKIKYFDRKATQKEINEYKDQTHYAGEGIKFKGYTDCGCQADFKPGIVLDPFMGAGTTAIVAKRLGRNFVGFELNPKYVEIANKRLSNQ